MKQQTICNEISISGIGIHSGEKSTITLCPNKENSGIVFQRIDLPNKPKVKALFSNVYSTNRSTNIRNKEAKILTIEHLLASITGEQIDNLLIKIDNIEVPILDGSSSFFTKIIKESGIKQQNEEKKYLEIKKKIFFEDKESGASYLVEPAEKLMLNVKLDYKSSFFKNQIAELEDINKFENEISSCRTFSLLHEVEGLIRKDLIKGGNLDNAVIIVDDYINDDFKNYLKNKLGEKNITFDLGKLLNKKELRFKNEPARHKLLDVIGDTTLLGKNIKAKITCFKPGHKSNLNLVKKLHKIMIQDNKNIAPEIDFNKKPFYDLEDIKKILPHREPFIFIDEIRELGDDYIIGVKYVKEEEEYFKGHFPGEPVMPGVIQLETMAQTGGVLILNTVDNPQDYLTFFMKIDNAKFKMKVIPGDLIIFSLSLISPIRRGLCHMHGKGFVNGKIVVEADLLAQIAKKK